ncbi:MAG: hypothetical protein GY810_01140 [Aureispira sp.]|nr:hypothetical protein [Aureispira sp.]
MKVQRIEKSWYKRRIPEKKQEIIDIQVVDFRKEYNHLCNLIVKYKAAPTATYVSRVIYDRGWIVDGGHVSVRIRDE